MKGILLCIVFVAGILMTRFTMYNIMPSSFPTELNLKTIDGHTIDRDDLMGETTLVVFWATTCASCIKEIPHLIALYEELNHSGLKIVAVAMAYDPPKRVIDFSKRNNLPYSIALDVDGSAARLLGNITITPTTLLIDEHGNIIERYVGLIDFAKLKDKIKTLLVTTIASSSSLSNYALV